MSGLLSFPGIFRFQSINGRIFLSALSGFLLAQSYINPDLYWTTWLCYVPFLFAIRGASLRQTYGLGLVLGLVCYALMTYWIVNFAVLFKGYAPHSAFVISVLFWFYCAQLSACLGLVFQWLSRRLAPRFSWTNFISFTLVFVMFYAWFPMLGPLPPGGTQYGFPLALQAIEFTGVFGLDALIAMCNIGIYSLLVQPRGWRSPAFVSACGFSALWFGFGVHALSEWDLKVAGWTTVRTAMIQPNEFPTLEKLKMFPGFSRAFPPEMEMTLRLREANVDLVIWPEARYKGYIDLPKVRAAFVRQVKAAGSALLFQDMGTKPLRPSHDKDEKYYRNMVVILDSDGVEKGHYQKIERIPFGEYLPWINDIPFLAAWAKDYFGNFLEEIHKGESFTNVLLGDVMLTPVICYETMFPVLVADAIAAGMLEGKRRGGLLVGVSSDAWFGESLQPYQHTGTSALRAVENRISFAHVLNNGPSLVVLPNGRMLPRMPAHQAGAFVVDIPYSTDQAGTFYTRHPQLFISVCTVLFGVLVLLASAPGLLTRR